MTERAELQPAFAEYITERVAPDDPQRYLSQTECEDILRTVQQSVRGHGITRVSIESRWAGDVRWARNRMHVVSNRRNSEVSIHRSVGPIGVVTLNQTDPQSIASAVRRAENIALDGLSYFGPPIEDVLPALQQPKTAIWSDSTFEQPLPARSAAVNRLTAAADKAGMLSAGYLNIASHAIAAVDLRASSQLLYSRQTFAQCSLTVRAPDGLGSGWAGVSSYDWSRIDIDRLGAIALDKCLRSRNPVVIEPGRYTVILEPQAVYELIRPVFDAMWRVYAENDPTNLFHSHRGKVTIEDWSRAIGFSKIGERLLDRRITIGHDPSDPELGVVPFSGINDVYNPVTWIQNGILTAMPYSRANGRADHHEDRGYPYSRSFRMSGEQTSIEEMIATTERGLIVTRFSTMREVGAKLLFTGLTRDGLWLIERGVVKHPVKNFRFTESPLFAFNQLEQIGVPVPIFSPETPAIVPPVKVRDFSFTSLIDAI